MIEIIPAVIPEDFEHLSTEIGKVADLVSFVQIDVIDGKFAPTKTWPYNREDRERWEKIVTQDEGIPYWQDVDFEIDLMVENQIEAAEDWISAGASRIIGHVESLEDENVERFKSFKKEYGIEIVFSLEPSTPNSVLDEHLNDIDAVQFMGSDKVGYHGVSLDEKVLNKIVDLRIKKPEMPIGIDIGVNFETVGKLAKAGVTRFSSGSLIFNSEDIKETIEEMKKIAEEIRG